MQVKKIRGPQAAAVSSGKENDHGNPPQRKKRKMEQK